MSAKDAQLAFYEHKRNEHSGAYSPRCSECAALWARYLAASKQAAGLEP